MWSIKPWGSISPINVGCLLFIEIDGNKKAVQENIEKINKICKANNGIENKWEDDPAKRLKMWAARQGIVALPVESQERIKDAIHCG